MDEDYKNRLLTATELVRGERRKYNNLFKAVVNGQGTEYNLEDLGRLIGELECAYNHILAALASDGDMYCVYKHLWCAVVLAGELDNPDVEALYDILSIVSDGKVSACMACAREQSAIMEESKRKENDD